MRVTILSNIAEIWGLVVVLSESLDGQAFDGSTSIALVPSSVFKSVVGGHSQGDQKTEGLEGDVEPGTFDVSGTGSFWEGEGSEDRKALANRVKGSENGL